MYKFIDLCLKGVAYPSQIEAYIEQWHNSDSTEEVDAYLGMTWDEYARYLRDDEAIYQIVEEHRQGKDLAVVKR